MIDAAETDIDQIIKLSDYKYEDDDERKELHSLYTLTRYNTQCKIQIQGNCRDHLRDIDFILLQSIVNETDEGSEMVEAYSNCFQTNITEPLIELDEEIEEECNLPATLIVKYIDTSKDSPKPLKHVVSTPLIKSKYKMRKISPPKLNSPPKKTDAELTSDRSKFSLEFARALEQIMKDDLISLQATISETKENMVQVIEDIKCSYKNELKVLKDLIDGKLQDSLDELNKLKHEKQSLEGKVTTLIGNVKSLEQTNKTLKDALTNREGRMNILFQDKQLMEGKFCTLNDKCKAKAKEILESVQYQASIILLHSGVNDVEQIQDQQKIASDFIEICKMTREKFPNASIIVSEFTPRQDDLQNVIKKVNVEINQRIKEVPDCLLINHDNLNSRELFHDKKHLEKCNGIPLLARNIKLPFIY